MTRISKASTRDLRDEFSFLRSLFRFSRCAMYSVALESTVAWSCCQGGSPSTAMEILTLLSLCAGVKPCRSSSISSPFESLLLITRSEGTESRSTAILSLRFVRYRFSIMLCAVFLIGGCLLLLLPDGLSSS